MHVLSNCPVVLNGERYTWRRNSVLNAIFTYMKNHPTEGWTMSVDLPGESYCFPPGFSQRPDIVAYNEKNRQVVLFELTIPFEENLVTAARRKQERYKA